MEASPGALQLTDDAEQTYFGLRIGMFLLIVLLGICLAVQWWNDDGVLCGSISAYYYTSVRPVFIGVLCAVGAALIVYRGSINLENTALDFAGFSAFVVAFVPTSRPGAEDTCTTVNVPGSSEIDGLVLTAVPGLLVVGLAAVVVGVFFLRRPQGSNLWLTVAAAGAIAIAAAAFFGWRFVYRPTVDGQLFTAHNIAAITLFVFMLVTIGLNAYDARDKNRSKYSRIYCALAVAMVAGCILFMALLGLRTHIFWAEMVGIAGFGAFWLIQTIELRHQLRRTPQVSE
jgi:hypothetical protein